MSSLCIKNSCRKCCQNTNMYLSNADINRIESIGYSKDFFVKTTNGFCQLKNKNNLCVFHNKKTCTIYDHRPIGCRLYPVVYNADLCCAILDDECPYKEKFPITKKKIKQLFSLVQTLIDEKS